MISFNAENVAIDFVGDIHGHCEALRALLAKLGYVEAGGTFRYPGNTRRVVFLGDYVDRGPKIRETLRLVRAMCEVGSATALLGNHEFNMLSFWSVNGVDGRFLKKTGAGYLRAHTPRNIKAHFETIKAFVGYEDEFASMQDFLKGLPLYLETDAFRAQHASFDADAVAALKRAGVTCFKDGDFATLISRANDEDGEYNDSLFHPIDLLLKVPEVALPGGRSFLDTDGKTRYNTRLRWWVNPARSRFAALSFQEKELGDAFGDCPVPEELKARAYYREDDRPVFFGHYWLKGEPHLQRDNVCCRNSATPTIFIIRNVNGSRPIRSGRSSSDSRGCRRNTTTDLRFWCWSVKEPGTRDCLRRWCGRFRSRKADSKAIRTVCGMRSPNWVSRNGAPEDVLPECGADEHGPHRRAPEGRPSQARRREADVDWVRRLRIDN